MSRFDPDAGNASALRRAMERALWDSAVQALASQGVGDAGELPRPARASALDFSAYFDLVLPPPNGEPVAQAALADAVRHLTQRPDRAPDSGGETAPRIANFAPPWFTAAQLDRLSRWWDTEPENAIALAGLDRDEFQAMAGLVGKGLAMLALACPQLHGELLACIDLIVIARPDGSQRLDFGGVTSFALWGAIALNADAHVCWEQCFQTLVHETAHNLLFAIARDRPLVNDDPSELCDSPLRGQLRPLDGIYHAMFVSAREAVALDRLLVRNEAEPCLDDFEAQRIETLLEGSVISFWQCADTLRAEAHLTELGEEVLRDCEAAMRASFSLVPD